MAYFTNSPLCAYRVWSTHPLSVPCCALSRAAMSFTRICATDFTQYAPQSRGKCRRFRATSTNKRSTHTHRHTQTHELIRVHHLCATSHLTYKKHRQISGGQLPQLPLQPVVARQCVMDSRWIVEPLADWARRTAVVMNNYECTGWHMNA